MGAHDLHVCCLVLLLGSIILIRASISQKLRVSERV